MTWTNARWFDGAEGAAQPVQVAVDAGELRLRNGEDRERTYALGLIRAQDAFPGLARVIELPDAGILHVNSEAAQKELGFSPRSPVMQLAAHWWSAIACTIALVALVIWLDQVAIGRTAQWAVQWVPASMEERFGNTVMATADAVWLRPSRVPAERQARIRERFYELLEHRPRTLLDFRDARNADAGFNAFALPGERVVVLDGMVQRLTDDELAWVLAHEVGHVAHRDAMRELARSFGVAAVATVLWSDFSSWATTMGAGVAMQAHSRDAERAADEYMREAGARVHLPLESQVSLWRKVQSYEQEHGIGDLPGWLSTHPATGERLTAAEEQAKQPRETDQSR